jgi:dTDP-4-amino-4,6-dideoxygalactose transaminase
MIKFLDLPAQYASIRSEIDAAVERTLRDAVFIGGDAVRTFEREFAAYQAAAHCVGVANATDGLEIAIEALGLPAGSEIIVPANSFIASSESVTRAGCRVVFADCDPANYGVDPEDVQRRVTKRTAAIMVVHLYGQPADLRALTDIAQRHGLKLIEDAAQAHGAEYDGTRVGAIGDVGVFSFYPGKNLGAYGDAGAIVSNDTAIAERCRMIANHGRLDKYNHKFEGRNSRLDSLQAAILSVKLRHLDQWVERRNAVASVYLEGLIGLPWLTLPGVRAGTRHAYHLFVVRSARRDALAAHLKAKGIETGIHYPIALPKLEAYAYIGQGAEPMHANRFDGQLLSLPIGEHLEPQDARRVVEAVRAFAG